MSGCISTNDIKEHNHLKNTKINKIRINILKEDYNLTIGNHIHYLNKNPLILIEKDDKRSKSLNYRALDKKKHIII